MNDKSQAKRAATPNPKALDHYDMVVIGSGPGGRRAAIQASKLGKSVLVVEKRDQVGGVSVHTGTIPSKTMRETVLNLTGWREREFYGLSYRVKDDINALDIMQRLRTTLVHEVDMQEHQYLRNTVEIAYASAEFLDPHRLQLNSAEDARVVSADKIVIAVGTKPFRPDYVPFDGKTVIDSDELLQLEKIPNSMVVIGAGVIGVEYATIFSALDVNVTLVDPRAKVLDFIDRELVQDFYHQLRERGLTLRLGQTVTSFEIGPYGRHLCKLDSGRELCGDVVLFTAGRVGNTEALNLSAASLEVDHRGRLSVDDEYRTSQPHIFAVGDVIGFPSLASTSMEQGRIAACAAFGVEAPKTVEYFPYGIYSVPEISTVGMSEEEVRSREIPYEVGVARFKETSRGQIMGIGAGMMKCIFSIKTKRLLGVHIVGEGATELIHIGQAVMAHKGTLDYFLDNTFNYPTLAEAYKIAALDAYNRLPIDAK